MLFYITYWIFTSTLLLALHTTSLWHHPTDRITHTTTFVTPVVEYWLEREIAQWVHPTKDRSDDPSHHERTLLPRSYISLPQWMRHGDTSIETWKKTKDRYETQGPIFWQDHEIAIFCSTSLSSTLNTLSWCFANLCTERWKEGRKCFI